MISDFTQLGIDHLEKAIRSLDRLHRRVMDKDFMSSQDEVVYLGLHAGLIRGFKLTYDFSWEMIARWLSDHSSGNNLAGLTRHKQIRCASNNHLIAEKGEWMRYHAIRIETSYMHPFTLDERTLTLIANFVRAAKLCC